MEPGAGFFKGVRGDRLGAQRNIGPRRPTGQETARDPRIQKYSILGKYLPQMEIITGSRDPNTKRANY